MTVDVSSSSQPTRAPRKDSHSEGTDADSLEEQQQEEVESGEPSSINPALRNNEAVTNGDKQAQSTSSDSLDRIQILDLHTENPLISYKNRIYSCSWGSTIGTDIFLTSPTALSALSQATEITPLKTLPEVSILGTSCIQLRARPVVITSKTDSSKNQLYPKPPRTNIQPHVPPTTDEVEPPIQYPTPTSLRPVPEQPAAEQAVSEQPVPEQTASEQPPSENPYPPHPFKIPLNISAPNSTRKQASFLESLQAIKTAKGETDQVTVHSTKFHQSYGWRARRKLEEMAEAMDLEGRDGEDTHFGARDPAQSTTVEGEQGEGLRRDVPSPAKRARRRTLGQDGMPKRIGRPRGSRSRGRIDGGRMGRDAIVQATDEAGPDAGNLDRTPVRWEDVEVAVPEMGDRGGSRKAGGVGPTPAIDVEHANDSDKEREAVLDVEMGEEG